MCTEHLQFPSIGERPQNPVDLAPSDQSISGTSSGIQEQLGLRCRPWDEVSGHPTNWLCAASDAAEYTACLLGSFPTALFAANQSGNHKACCSLAATLLDLKQVCPLIRLTFLEKRQLQRCP